jgi:DNA-binding transcriptional MerR regulator
MQATQSTQTAPRLTIGQAAERTGLSIYALRFYEREGLLANPIQRGADGRRSYSDDDLEWLDLCMKLRSSGMPLTAIRQYAELVRQGSGNEQARLTILREHQRCLSEQIGALTACLDMISFKIGCYEDSLAAGGADPIWAPSS